MDLFALRLPFVDFEIMPAGINLQQVLLYTDSGYSGALTLPIPHMRRFMDSITLSEPAATATDLMVVTKYGNYKGPLLGEDYTRYHTEEL